ncbi:MAG TPA: acetate--CoA ligase family protein [Candidatus Dormibacteraeota bacterium]|nr:acetate--CoA ligase family protein [Candidatus Dormibacteraeota bacterium]
MTRAATGASAATPATRSAIDLHPLFAPRSIAIVGASPRSDLARTMRDNIPRVGSETRCHFVNPRYEEVDGSPCYPDLASLPEVPDIVVVALNPLRAPAIVREAAAAGVPAVVIPGGGVVEGGEPAAQMQAEVAAIAIEAGIALVGPNCMGVIDLTTPSATYIDDLPANLRRGGMAAIAQSGSVTDAFVHAGTRIGWSRIISCGAEVVLDTCDYLAACLDDPSTESVALFLEGFKRPELFLALADRALTMDKPILAVKVGSSPQARAAAIAHTGSLAGDARATDAALRAAGVVRCHDLDELIEAAALVSRSRRIDRRVGRGRTAVVTVSTGEGSLIADLAPRIGLDLPAIPAATQARISTALPTLAHVANPIDPWGAGEGAPTYRATFEALVDSGAYDVLALVHDFPYRSQPGEVALAVELGAELLAATEDHPEILPVFVSLTSGDVTPEVEAQHEAAGGSPILRGTTPAFGAIARLAWWERRHAARAASGPIRPAWPRLAERVQAYGHDPAAPTTAARATPARSIAQPLVVIPERESLELLRGAGLPIVASIAVEGTDARAMLESVAQAADALGWPVAIKLDAPGLAHKSDVGGVVLGVESRKALPGALRRVLASGRDHDADGVLVQSMVASGVELIVGARRDPQFGPLVLVGIGGIYAEALDDAVVRLAPISANHARDMLGELRGSRLLEEVRGRRCVNRAAVAAIIAGLGDAMDANPTWREVDLNPVIATSTAAVAVDALIVTDPVHPAWDYEDPGGAAPS